MLMMSRMKNLYTFTELQEQDDALAIVGSKAASLLSLLKIGVQVPDGLVLSTQAFRDFIVHNQLSAMQESVLQQLRTPDAVGVDVAVAAFRQSLLAGSMPPDISLVLRQLSETQKDAAWAVRSSCTQEDLAGASFAGIYETVLNVRGELALQDAIRQCWASLFGDSVVRYCAHNRIALEQGSMAVILQRMVIADASGVAFSVNPQSGHDTEMVIEACFGLGEALVAGQMTPDQYRYDWYREQLTGRDINHKALRILAQAYGSNVTEMLDEQQGSLPVLDETQVLSLAQECLRIQKSYGFPVDIEWTMQGGQFYFVQARPITAIHYAGVNMEWSNADFKDGGVSSSVCSTYMWSLYDYIWEAICPDYTSSIRIHPEFKVDAWGHMFFARPYWNLTAIKAGVKSLPGFVEREFDESVGVKVNYEGNGHVTPMTAKILARGVNVLLRLKWIIWRSKSRLAGFKQEQMARLEALPGVLENLSDKDLPAFYTRFVNEEYYRSEYTYFHHIFSTNNVMTLFRDDFKKLKSSYTVLDFISGLAGLSHLHLNIDLWDCSQDLRKNEIAAAYWSDTPMEQLIADWRNGSPFMGMDKVAAVVERHKYRSTRELDITVERFGENPQFIFENLKQCLALGGGSNPHDGVHEQAEKHAEKMRQFAASLPFHKRAGMLKKIEELRFYLWWREELRDLSTAYYYWVRQLTLRVGKHLQGAGILDQVEDIFHLSKDEVVAVLDGSLDAASASQRWRKNRDYYQSFRHFTPPDEIGAGFLQTAELSDASAAATSFKGIPCSQGIVEGRVKVIANIQDAERLEKGDILITRFTDPGWTAKFPLLAAVATETGGLLSHAAVISREYGIPAVLAVKNLTGLLVDGQLVRIDGGRGLVEVIHE